MAETPVEVVRRLHAKITNRKANADKWSSYYEGKRPLLYTTAEFREMSGGLFDDFSDNWCQVVPDAVVERLDVLGFRLEDGTLDKDAMRAWRRNECDVEFSLAALESLISKRSFGLVWKPDGVNTEITFQSTDQAIVEYVPGRRNVRKYGLLITSEDEYDFATLWSRAGTLEIRPMVYRFQRTRGAGEWVARTVPLSGGGDLTHPNPMGNEVPLVELANRARLRGKARSEIETVAPLQDALNTIWAHLMTGSDAAALPARVVLGTDRPERDIIDPETDEVIGTEDLPIAPFRRNRMMWLEGREASIAEFSAGDLSNYLRVIEVAVQHIAAQTRTPPHYLLGQMVNISADALTAAESGLVAKVVERQRFLGSALRELMRLEALASGDSARASSLALGRVVWRDAQFRSEAVYADALTKYKAIGVPDEALWERMPGVDSDEIDRWKTMRSDQAAAIVGGNLSGLFGPKPPEDGEGPPPAE